MAEVHKIHFEGYELDLDSVLAMIPGSSRDYIIEALEDLFEDAKDQGVEMRPYAQWMALPVEPVDEDHVKVGTQIYEDTYLAGRLKGISQVFAYYSQVSESLMAYHKAVDDALDSFLMNYALTRCLNVAFEAVVEEVAPFMPDYSIGCMDNPGIELGWRLAGNLDIGRSFAIDGDGTALPIPLKENGLCLSSFSFMGLIYGKMPEGGCTGPWRKKLPVLELVAEIEHESGH